MYAEAQQQRPFGNQIRGAGLGVCAAGTQYSEPKTMTDTVIGHTEIDGELNNLRQNIERLLSTVGALHDRLYPVLAGELNSATAGTAPQPVMNSPLGQSLRLENERLYDVASRIDAIRARVQL